MRRKVSWVDENFPICLTIVPLRFLGKRLSGGLGFVPQLFSFCLSPSIFHYRTTLFLGGRVRWVSHGAFIFLVYLSQTTHQDSA